MKRVFILIGLLFLLSYATVCAEDITIDYEMDFDNSVIKISLTTEAKYNQALSVILYKGDTMGSDLSKIVKIEDIDADENGDAYVELKLADEIPSGEYLISVSGGGSIRNTGSKVISFVSKADLSQIVDDVNSATQTDIKSKLAAYSDIFDIPTDDGVYTQFLLIKKEDDGNSFTSVNEIAKALKSAKLLFDINNLETEAALLNYLKSNSKELGVNVDDDDFTAYEEKFASAFVKLKKTRPLTGMSSFEKMWNESLAIGAVNSCNSENMTAAIMKYGAVIGISSGDYQSNCKKYGEVEINKALRDKNFSDCQAIVTAYKNRIADLGKGQTVGGGSSGGGGGGSAVPPPVSVAYVNPVADVPRFTDFIDLSEAELL